MKGYFILNCLFWEKFSHWSFLCYCHPLFHMIWFHLQYEWNRKVPRPCRSLLELWQSLIMMIISEKITKATWYMWQKQFAQNMYFRLLEVFIVEIKLLSLLLFFHCHRCIYVLICNIQIVNAYEASVNK
jgi:hypothetical protein